MYHGLHEGAKHCQRYIPLTNQADAMTFVLFEHDKLRIHRFITQHAVGKTHY